MCDGAFANLLKATITALSCLFVSKSASPMEKIDSHRTDFHEI
jgi:hypothetical protein